ncbi:aminoglycoside phosphotransferase family protein [Streptomyces sp. NBC_01275]|uniref:phosphotransferase family protein n=1 Tax=Streptomyces sp. NBC_01275 TaxID=2903807 RepID=UPI0022514C0D|nr:phosphotransferase [Streptomyces sp. NBC_01275]MCX4764738.1 aminoglycoside phosphotransferase family protein [Streptomyces sp. NBC_01275]
MTRIRQHLALSDLAPLAAAAAGPHRALAGVSRVHGGTKKGSYRLAYDDGSTAIAYVWSPQENYWDDPEAGAGVAAPDPRAPFSPATGLDLFVAAHDRLTAAGVRAPRLLLVDPDRRYLPADAVVVEDVRGGSLEEALDRDPAAAAPIVDRLAGQLRALHAHAGPRYGKVAVVDAGLSSHGTSCVQAVLDGALRDVEEAARRDARIGVLREAIAERVRDLAAAVEPRSRYTLIHGELGPDHVLLTADGEPVLIDVEGLMYFDVEHEHVFLALRFGEWYDRLRAPGLELDEDRLAFYRLAMHVSLVAGPLRLLDGDFPRPAEMRAIAESNLLRVLELVGP